MFNFASFRSLLQSNLSVNTSVVWDLQLNISVHYQHQQFLRLHVDKMLFPSPENTNGHTWVRHWVWVDSSALSVVDNDSWGSFLMGSLDLISICTVPASDESYPWLTADVERCVRRAGKWIPGRKGHISKSHIHRRVWAICAALTPSIYSLVGHCVLELHKSTPKDHGMWMNWELEKP